MQRDFIEASIISLRRRLKLASTTKQADRLRLQIAKLEAALEIARLQRSAPLRSTDLDGMHGTAGCGSSHLSRNGFPPTRH